LRDLDYEITFPTIYRFLERYHSMSEGTPIAFMLSCYLCELTLVEVKMNKWLPSRIACSALYLAKKMLKDSKQPWSKEMVAATGQTERQIRDSAREICVLINLAHTKKVFEPIYKKYSTNKYLKVA